MPLIATAVPLDSVKMDERKRPASDDPSTPRVKRQAITVNGVNPKAELEMPRDDDLERFTKDAILRQMKEYRREKQTVEQQLAQVNKKCVYHDDHLRLIDGWFLQLLDELSILADSVPSQSSDKLEFSSSLLSAEPKQFQEHLGQRSAEIRASITKLLSKVPAASSDVRELQERLSGLLVSEKVHIAELQKVNAEKDSLDDRLFTATNRYMTAEKQLDRSKSAQVAKLEAQAIASSRPEAGRKASTENVKSESTEGTAGIETLEAARKEALAISGKQKEQLEALAAENTKLTEELSAAQMKLSTISDDDYANTELFKNFKNQHAEVVKRINDLEAKNIELRDEAKLLQAERTVYREKIDNEFRDQDVAMQSEIAQKDADLTRIRGQRDEIMADLTVQKSTADANKESHDRFKELADARQLRISTLESEVDRLRLQEQNLATTDSEADSDVSSLRSKIQKLQMEKSSLEQELISMETAWKKASSLAATKLNDLLHHEERLKQLSEEKTKADQKYFSARKLMDAREQQFRDMQKQVSKSSEIVSTLKEAESSCRALLVNAEKQLAETKDALQSVTNQHRVTQQIIAEQKTLSTQVSSHVEELQKLLTSKVEVVQTAKKSQREAEVKVEQLKLSLEQSEKDLQTWKQKALGNQNEDYLSMKKLCWCTVCDKNIKDTVLKTCKHVMCRECIENRLSLRARRCPICNMAFGANDTIEITL